MLIEKSSLRVPDGIEGLTWLSGPENDLEEDEQFWGFHQLCKIAIRHKVVSSSFAFIRIELNG
jgi:hypothetical protein